MTDGRTVPCPHCAHDNPARAKFCLECGRRLAPTCAACGAELPEAAKFCMECGRPVAATGTAPSAEAAPPERAVRAPAAYTPRHLAERILTSRAALAGERKAVTVLFCDLVGSTALAERLGPEGMHALINGFFETALAEVHRYEGTVNQFLGDGFMALFGAPLAHEDHARRAVLAALAIARVLRDRPILVAPGTEIPLTVRMGLHTGFVLVGAIGDNLRMDYTAVGDTTHLAARLQQMAEPGAILASEATWRPVEGYVQGERVGPVEVRGRSGSVVVFRLLGVGSRRSALEGVDPRGLSHFVGRDRELDTLLDLYAAAAEGRGQALGLVGEPGVGKSRLLLEFRHRLANRAATYLQGRCLSYGAAIPYVPVADILRASCGVGDTDPPESVAEKIRFGLLEVGMDPDAGGPYLVQMLGGKDPTGRLDALGPEVIKARTFETLRQMALRTSRKRPLILEVEDFHWVDRTSEEYFAFLAESLLGAPIFLIATYRPGYRPPWSDRSFASQLSLGRLTVDESRAIVQALLPASDSEPLARVILDKAEGNPFFLEELARAVSDQGLGADLPIPDTVHGVLTARIDRLAEEPKRALQTASVLGREFTARLLAALWDGPGRSSRTSATWRARSSSSSARPATTPCTSSSMPSPRTSPRRRSCPRDGASSTAGRARRSRSSIPTASPSWRRDSPTTTSRRRHGHPPPSMRGARRRPPGRSSRTRKPSPATTRPSPPPSAPGWHRPRAASCTRAGRTCTRSSAISSSPAPTTRRRSASRGSREPARRGPAPRGARRALGRLQGLRARPGAQSRGGRGGRERR